MSDVFGAALGASGDFLREAAIDAGYELGIFDALVEPRTLDEIADAIGVGSGRRRMGALLDVLAAMGVLAKEVLAKDVLVKDVLVKDVLAKDNKHVVREGDRYGRVHVPARPVVARAGWGLMADVIRGDKPLPVEHGEHDAKVHKHLAEAGAHAARELMQCVQGRQLLDLGGGAGAYTAAFLDGTQSTIATIVDSAEIIELAKHHLARFGDRVRFVVGDIRTVEVDGHFDLVLLSNVIHHYGPLQCQHIVEAASKWVARGIGELVVKDLRIEEGRGGPIEGLLFALNMAIYTGEGDVYERSTIAWWLESAGLVGVRELRLAEAPDSFAIIGRSIHADALDIFHDWTGLPDVTALEAELDAKAAVNGGKLPRPLRSVLAHAVALDRDGSNELVEHYTHRLPAQRKRMLDKAPGFELMHAELDWNRLPRMGKAIDRLFTVLANAGVEPTRPLGAASAKEYRARSRTLAEIHARAHYGGINQMLYGDESDLAYFARRGLGTLETIDRYMVAPVIHELCHFHRDRDALPPHLDESIGGWLGVYVWPEMAYPDPGEDDALYAAPWLAQIGQAFARTFGIRNIIRAQTGAMRWSDVMSNLVGILCRFYWNDWKQRRSLHLLCDTSKPGIWTTLVSSLAGPRADDEFDRAIVIDGLKAMCLTTIEVDGRRRVRTHLPTSSISVDRAGVRCAQHHYFLPQTLQDHSYELELRSLDAIPDAAAAICAASPSVETEAYKLTAR